MHLAKKQQHDFDAGVTSHHWWPGSPDPDDDEALSQVGLRLSTLIRVVIVVVVPTKRAQRLVIIRASNRGKDVCGFLMTEVVRGAGDEPKM
jgi:hypothetical protein